jgi:hypothetical protein
MLPASDLTEILTNLAALQLAPDTAAAVLGAVLAPLLRSEIDPVPNLRPIRRKRAGPRSSKRLRGAPRKRRYRRHVPSKARDRALAALKANPDATPTEIAKIAEVSRSTVVNAREDLAKETRKQARKAARATSSTAKPPSDHRQRAQQFLKDTLARGPKLAADVEDAAEKAHVGLTALDQARAELGVVTSRSNAGGVQAVQWSLPG